MQLRDIMTREIETIRPDATVQQAAQKMASLNIGMLPVTEKDKLVGTITDRDITVRVTVQGLDTAKTPVRAAMTPVVICGIEDQDVKAGAQLMMDNQIRRLIVINRDNQPVGIVSLADLAISVDDDLTGQILRQVSGPAKVHAHA